MKHAIWATPFLLGATSVLHLWSQNPEATDLRIVLPWLGFNLAAAGVALGLSFAVLRDRAKAIALASLVVALALLYGHASAKIYRSGWVTDIRAAKAIVGAAWLVLGATGAVFLARTKRDLRRGLAATCAFVAVACGVTLLRWKEDATAVPEAEAPIGRAAALLEGPIPSVRAPEPLPDIYYIVLDGYARADVLRTHFGHDNGDFLDALRGRGFWIGERSRANFPITFMALASALSMTPLEDLARDLGPESSDRRPLLRLIQGNRASRFLKAKGYRYATTLTNYYATETSETADVAYAYLPRLLRSEFAQAYLRSTLACLWEPSLAGAHQHAFRSIEEAAELEGPTFLFAHLILPHSPYVFRRDGSVRADVPLSLQWKGKFPSELEDYVDQLVYLNSRILEIVDRILASAKTPPVIILQSDHGQEAPDCDPDPRARAIQRMPILSAFLAPEAVRRRLYDNITPVNTFRVLLSELFGADLPLVPDRSYMCSYKRAYELLDVTDEVDRAWTPDGK